MVPLDRGGTDMKKGYQVEGRLETNLTNDQLKTLAVIAEKAAVELRQPGAFTQDGVSLDANDRSVELWSGAAVKHDVLGWILRIAAKELNDSSEQRARCVRASSHIGRRVFECCGRSMIDINDRDGCDAVADALTRAAASFRSDVRYRTSRPHPLYKHVA